MIHNSTFTAEYTPAPCTGAPAPMLTVFPLIPLAVLRTIDPVDMERVLGHLTITAPDAVLEAVAAVLHRHHAAI